MKKIIIFAVMLLLIISSVFAAAPSQATLVTPTDGATNTAIALTLNVTVADTDGDNTTVTFYYYNGTAYETLYEEVNVTTGSNVIYVTDGVTYPLFDEGTLYQWYVNTSDETLTTQSDVWNFTTSNEPTIVVNSPTSGATNTARDITINTTVTDADGDNTTAEYICNGETIYTEENVTTGSTVTYTADGTINDLFDEGTYYLCTLSFYDGLSARSSEVINFTTSDAPTIVLNSPADNYEIDQSTISEISLTLSATVNDTDGDNITVIIYDASDNSVLKTETVTGGQGTVTYLWEDLVDDETYSWYVTAADDESTTTSSTRSFGVETTVNTGITGVKTVTFAAFALLVVMLLTAIAMLIVTTIQKGADVNQLMSMAIYVIGGAIVIFIGYLIIASVANGLI